MYHLHEIAVQICLVWHSHRTDCRKELPPWCCHAATDARSVSTVLLRPRGHTPRALVASGISSTAVPAAGSRLRLGGGVALRLRFARRSPPPPLHFPARRPQTEPYAPIWPDHLIQIHEAQSRRAVRVNPRLDCGSPDSASIYCSPCCPLRSKLTRRPAPGVLPLGIRARTETFRHLVGAAASPICVGGVLTRRRNKRDRSNSEALGNRRLLFC